MKHLITTLAFLAAVLVPTLSDAATEPQRPNIVFIFSDDHAWQAVSAYGDDRKLLQTPNIDRIADEGIRFDRCLVTNSICGPARAAILTGTYSHVNGFYQNGDTFDGSQTTFAKLLQSAGYQTAMIGKWHLESDPTGFDYWHILPGQGLYYNPPMIDNGRNVKHEGHTTDIITELSVDWLRNRDTSQPFLLMMQHKAPHRRWEPALRHLGWDNDRKHAEPKNLFDNYENRGLAERDQDMTIAVTMTEHDLKFPAHDGLTPEQRAAWEAYYEPRNAAYRKARLRGYDQIRWRYQRYMHDYLGCIVGVDESVGRVLDQLDELGLSENTLVVYTSDQGFFLGEHGWFDKRWIFEESLRSPLVMRWPGVIQPGRATSSIVSNIDFAETFLEIAGLAIPKRMQGRSLLPILEGRTPDDWRESFYYQYYEFPGPHHVRKHYGVVTERYKLIQFYDTDADYMELFDLRNDPLEMRDVYFEPTYSTVRDELRIELARLREELGVPDENLN